MCNREEPQVAKKSVDRSVLFYKRMIAATLALIILTLAALSAVLGVNVYHMRKTLDETEDKLFDYELAEMQRRAEEEAERLANVIPPEQEKPAGELSGPEILAQTAVVAHALGDVDGIEGLNCLEGFLAHYNAGTRVFEADLRLTSDGYVVLRHDWISGVQEGIDPTNIPTLEKFLATPIKEQYTPLSFHDLLLLMVQYPDICIITDTKLLDEEAVTQQFESMLEDAHKLGLTYLFDRIIVQIYSPNHFVVVNGVHHFPHYIYTLYQDYFGQNEESFRNKAVFCEENGIMGLTLEASVWKAAYEPIASWRNINVYTHTINDADQAAALLRTGIKAVYSDSLVPSDLED